MSRNQTSFAASLESHPAGQLVLPRRRLWQVVFLALALIPAVSSIIAIVVGVDRFVDGSEIDPALDNTYRYLGGVYLGVALMAIWSIVRIEQRFPTLLLATAAISLGGAGRLVSMLDVGAPSGLAWSVLVIEFGAVVLALGVRRTIGPRVSVG